MKKKRFLLIISMCWILAQEDSVFRRMFCPNVGIFLFLSFKHFHTFLLKKAWKCFFWRAEVLCNALIWPFYLVIYVSNFRGADTCWKALFHFSLEGEIVKSLRQFWRDNLINVERLWSILRNGFIILQPIYSRFFDPFQHVWLYWIAFVVVTLQNDLGLQRWFKAVFIHLSRKAHLTQKCRCR